MELRITATGNALRGLPRVDVAIETGALRPVRFPDPSAIFALESRNGLPFASLRVASALAGGCSLVSVLPSGAASSCRLTGLGEDGKLTIAGARRPAFVFHGKLDRRTMTAVATAIRVGTTTLIFIFGRAGSSPGTTPAEIASDPDLEPLVQSLTVEPERGARVRITSPLEVALQEIDDLRQLLDDGSRVLAVGDFLDSRIALVAALGATRAMIDELVTRGHRRSPDGDLALDVATLPELDYSDPLEPNVEGALRRLGQLVEPLY